MCARKRELNSSWRLRIVGPSWPWGACARGRRWSGRRVRRASKAKHPAMRHGKPPQPLCNSEVRGREC